MFSKFCFSRFHGKFQLSQCCFSVFNFRRTTIKFLFLRFHCQIPIFTLPLSKFQFFTLLLARFNFYAYALKTFGGNNCLFSNWICLRNFGATCHQRSRGFVKFQIRTCSRFENFTNPLVVRSPRSGGTRSGCNPRERCAERSGADFATTFCGLA